MFGFQILAFFKKHKCFENHFGGVRCIDSLEVPEDRQYFIVNTSTNAKKVGHWFVCGRRGSNLEIFDSLGRPKLSAAFLKNFKKYDGNVVYNLKRYQPPKSTYCGFFAIYFLFRRLLNLDTPLHKFLSSVFSSNPKKNDAKVKTFVQKYLK